MAEQRAYYNLLGLSSDRTYTADEIKHAYRVKSKQYHPDKHPQSESTKWGGLFNKLTTAMEWLIKNNHKKYYTRSSTRTARTPRTEKAEKAERTWSDVIFCQGLTKMGVKCKNHVSRDNGHFCRHHKNQAH